MGIWNFFNIFKSESIEDVAKRSVKEMKERVEDGLFTRGYQRVYHEEMQKLEELEADIVTPGRFVVKRNTYRDRKIRVFTDLLKQYKKYFTDNMDNKLQMAEYFKNEAGKANSRDRFLRNVKENGIEQVWQNEKGQNIMGAEDHPSAFQTSESIKRKFQEEKEKKQGKVSVKFIEDEIQKDVKESIIKFEPKTILKRPANNIELNTNYNALLEQYNRLKEIMTGNYNPEKTEQLKKLAQEMCFDKINSSLGNILQRKEAKHEEINGLDFMTKRHPEILADVMFHKVLTKIKYVTRNIVLDERSGNREFILEPEGYVGLLAQEQIFSRISSEFSLLSDDLDSEYVNYRNQLIHAKVQEQNQAQAQEQVQDQNQDQVREKDQAQKQVKEQVKEQAQEQAQAQDQAQLKEISTQEREEKIETNLKNLFLDSENEELYRLRRIKACLEKYTKLSTVKAEDRHFDVYKILQGKDFDYCVNLKNLGDFSYLVYSTAGGILPKKMFKGKTEKIHGLGYMAQNYPELMDNFVAYALLRQLKTEVEKVGIDKIPNFDMKKYHDLMQLMNGINIEKCKDSVKQVKVEFDEKLEEIAKLTPELYINYERWYNLTCTDKQSVDEVIPNEDIRVLDTNDISKLKELMEKYNKDSFLKKHLEYRIKQIQHIEKIGKKGPDPEILQDKKLEDLSEEGFGLLDNDNFTLNGISHKRQTTTQGCWSVVLSEMLSFKGIQLSQFALRSYRAVPSYEDKKVGYDQNMGNGTNMGSHMNLIAKVLPNSALHRVNICTLGYNKDKLVYNLKDKIRNAVKGHQAPMGVCYGGHYILITGLKGDNARIYDPHKKDYFDKNLGDFVKGINDANYMMELFWLTDINIKDDHCGIHIDRSKEQAYHDIIEYDEQGNLLDLKVDEYGNRQTAEDYFKELENHNGSIPTLEADYEYRHENYGAYCISTNDDGSEAEYIYLPRKLKLEEEKNQIVEEDELDGEVKAIEANIEKYEEVAEDETDDEAKINEEANRKAINDLMREADPFDDGMLQTYLFLRQLGEMTEIIPSVVELVKGTGRSKEYIMDILVDLGKKGTLNKDDFKKVLEEMKNNILTADDVANVNSRLKN